MIRGLLQNPLHSDNTWANPIHSSNWVYHLIRQVQYHRTKITWRNDNITWRWVYDARRFGTARHWRPLVSSTSSDFGTGTKTSSLSCWGYKSQIDILAVIKPTFPIPAITSQLLKTFQWCVILQSALLKAPSPLPLCWLNQLPLPCNQPGQDAPGTSSTPTLPSSTFQEAVSSPTFPKPIKTFLSQERSQELQSHRIRSLSTTNTLELGSWTYRNLYQRSSNQDLGFQFTQNGQRQDTSRDR